MNGKLLLKMILFSYPLAFSIMAGLVEGWVLFFEYGWQWNELTVPPLVLWDIFLSNIMLIAVTSIFISFVLIFIFYAVME